ncbi:flp pilus-assembly TadE/G-like family protein [Amycolatopsis thermalba]|uniref:Flp pilus-assembly TadE/G-like family protein n=1 Tax=Amycolatopsis thermalba TaxID=944492 RepID=A0ABY4P5G0_9PSEU|nr:MULTISPECIES: Rv3654c family TadE-like protein [Amycolatopsis]UQS27665.1 flp pilus-assembly TadE/G-like family protein [Amycolatopsis thermalba]
MPPGQAHAAHAPRLRNDRGAATVWAACAIAALVVVAGLLWGLGSAAIARHRAGGAADLAALAAAGQVGHGTDLACGRARWVAERMGARVVSCRFEGWDALVEVVVDTGLGSAVGRARAGP